MDARRIIRTVAARSIVLVLLVAVVSSAESPSSLMCDVSAAENPTIRPIPYSLGPHAYDTDTFDVDSESLLMNENPWYVTSGEIHMARVPRDQWREQLLRMKSGGLDSIAVYFFWIHHEEIEDTFDFSGRRNVSEFLSIARDVGLRVLARIGPWDHGECRNGGHPDWILERASRDGFKLRNNNTQYMSYVRRYYEELSKQMTGMFFSQGGPIFAVQVDNETNDWKYLLALRELAISVGMAPATFVKTGWPAPSAGYPSDYPMLPFFGGYPDNFWNNDMHDDPSTASYYFADGKADPSPAPKGYPWLDVEIGGGMATSYNHRVKMESDDMPSMHLVFVGNGVNQLGYYMYHGGLNPHSVTGDDFDPATTLQESSFMPAGSQNPMPSFSYDFFAPLGELGQPRPHFHTMRRLHLFLRDFGGSHLARSSYRAPRVLPSGTDDKSTLRWGVRAGAAPAENAEEAGFLFVNNYERLQNLSTKRGVRFALELESAVLHVPSSLSDPIDVASGAFFVWPFNFYVHANGSSAIKIGWATAQMLCSVETSAHRTALFFAATAPGVAVELGIDTGVADVRVLLPEHAASSVSREGEWSVVRGIVPSTNVSVTLEDSASGKTVDVVVLPGALADRVWKTRVFGRERVVVSDAGIDFVFADDDETLHLRVNTSEGSPILTESGGARVRFSVVPAPPSLRPLAPDASSIVRSSQNGIFTAFTMSLAELEPLPKVTWHRVRDSPGPRVVPIAASGKAQEPSARDWSTYAAAWSVNVSSLQTARDEIRLAVRYAGDCARVSFASKMLTDNWFSGYRGDGQMEVGLSYLAGENPGLMSSPTTSLTLEIIPLNRSDVGSRVYIQEGHLPAFDASGVALSIEEMVVLRMRSIAFAIGGRG